jgi:hypothetical protein
MQIRDRIKDFRRVYAHTLRPNPKNWRTHPPAQHDALRGVLAEIGYAGALVARELTDGSLELIDGHLRAETTPDMKVPVLVLDLTADEADKLLATFDTLSQLAGINPEASAALVAGLNVHHEAVRKLVDGLSFVTSPLSFVETADSTSRPISRGCTSAAATSQDEFQTPRPVQIPKLYQIVVQCDGESSQRTLYERLTAEGYDCRVLTL